MSASAAGGRPRAGRPGDPREPREEMCEHCIPDSFRSCDDEFDRFDQILGRIEIAFTLVAVVAATWMVALIVATLW